MRYLVKVIIHKMCNKTHTNNYLSMSKRKKKSITLITNQQQKLYSKE